MSNDSNAQRLGTAVEAQCETAGLAKRDRLWDEMSDVQKMDEMRREIRSMDRVVRELRKLENIVRGHIHAPNGDVFVPANDGRNEAYGYNREILK